MDGRDADPPRGRTAVRVRMPASAVRVRSRGEAAPAPALPAATRISLDVKSLQHRAFARGREVERQESSERLAVAARFLQVAVQDLRAARSGDRAELEAFAVRLAAVMAEELVARTIDEEGHDVRTMAQRVLDQVLPDLDPTGAVELHAHPDDVARLPRHFTEQGPGPEITVVADGGLDRGSFRVVAGGGEFYSGINERLEAMRERLLEEIRGDARS